MEVRICDPCLLAAPRATDLLASAYRFVITHFPSLWARMFRFSDGTDFGRRGMPFMGKPEQFVGDYMKYFEPDAVISTYPVYPYFISRLFRGRGPGAAPVYTVVTDSIIIHGSWLRAPSDHWIVTDGATRDAMSAAGVPAERIHDTGFPVHPDFAAMPSIDGKDACRPFRVVYFPTPKTRDFMSHCRELLDASPEVRLTIVMGRNFALLRSRALLIRKEYAGRVRLIGWTRRIPKLLAGHHLAVGKAGGATVHECIAAGCPMLIHHLVPGQEEGNLRLLESIGSGKLCDRPSDLKAAVKAMLEEDASGWRKMKAGVARHDRKAGALAAVDLILGKLAESRA